MQKGKKIISKPSPKPEAQMGYFDDVSKPYEPVKQTMIRPSFLITRELSEKIDEYIYQKRTQGEIHYTKANFFREASHQFLNLDKDCE